MTDDWDFYAARVDDRPASIFVDLGAAQAAPVETLPLRAHVRLFMNSPRPDGGWEERVGAAMTGFTEYEFDAGVSEDRAWSSDFDFL